MKSPRKSLNRRQVATLALGTTFAPMALTRHGSAAEDDKKKAESRSKEPQFLFVQSARKVAFADGKMTLKGINPTTIFFSDRPDRITGHESTEEFLKEWDQGEDSFEIDNPNATLALVEGGEKPVDIIVVLSNPVLEKRNLTYDVKILEGVPPKSAGACTLVIDVIGRPRTPLSAAGTARRTTRRVVRRRVY